MLHGAPMGTYSKSSGAKADEFPTVRTICGKSVVDDFRLRRIVELCFDVAVAQDAVDFGYVQVAILECDAVGVVQAAGESDDAPLLCGRHLRRAVRTRGAAGAGADE